MTTPTKGPTLARQWFRAASNEGPRTKSAPQRPARARRTRPLQVKRCTADSAFYTAIVDLRADVSGRSRTDCVDFTDSHSEHYCAMRGDQIVLAVRVTRASRGPLECEAHLPPSLVADFRPQLASSGRLVRRRGVDVGVEEQFLKVVWRDQIAMGIRLDATDLSQQRLSLFSARGYNLLPGTPYLHPRWGTLRFPAVLAGDRVRPRSLSVVMAEAHGALDWSDVQSAVNPAR